MKKIEKKCWPKYFKKILSREKTFDIRLADWKCSVGDTLVLKKWSSKIKDLKFFKKGEIDKYGFQIIGLK